MKLLLSLGKVLILTLWLAIAYSFLQPLNKPFDLLLPACGGALLLARLLTLLLSRRVGTSAPRGWTCRLQVLLFGALHLYAPAKDSRA